MPQADPRPNAFERRGNVAPEPRRVVLAGIQRQPCCGVPALASEVPEQRRLAEPGWGAYQGEPTTYRLGKAAEQRTRHDASAGDVELRGQKSWRSVAPPGGSVVTSCAIGASLSQQPGSRPTAQMPEPVWATPPTNHGHIAIMNPERSRRPWAHLIGDVGRPLPALRPMGPRTP